MKFQLLSDEIEIASKRELEREIISEGKFDLILSRAREAVDLVKEAREGS